MSDLIDRNAFANRVLPLCTHPESLKKMLDEEPTVDAEPIVHAHWIIDEDGVQCSNCHEKWAIGDYADDVKLTLEDMRHCPSCGAKMTGVRS